MLTRKNLALYAVTLGCLGIAWARGTLFTWEALNAASDAVFGYLLVVGMLRFYLWWSIVRETRRYLRSNPFAYLALARMEFATEYGAPAHSRTAVTYCPMPCGAPLGLGHEHIPGCPRFGD